MPISDLNKKHDLLAWPQNNGIECLTLCQITYTAAMCTQVALSFYLFYIIDFHVNLELPKTFSELLDFFCCIFPPQRDLVIIYYKKNIYNK